MTCLKPLMRLQESSGLASVCHEAGRGTRSGPLHLPTHELQGGILGIILSGYIYMRVEASHLHVLFQAALIQDDTGLHASIGFKRRGHERSRHASQVQTGLQRIL